MGQNSKLPAFPSELEVLQVAWSYPIPLTHSSWNLYANYNLSTFTEFIHKTWEMGAEY